MMEENNTKNGDLTNRDIIKKIEDSNKKIRSEFQKSSNRAMLISALSIMFAALLSVLGFFYATKNIDYLWMAFALILIVSVLAGLTIGLSLKDIIINIRNKNE